jgi:hypothetical protein
MAGEVTVAVLQSLYGRPAYRLTGVFGQPSTVFADTGEIAGPASLEQGRAEVARFINTPPDRVRHAGTVTEVDQWTIAQARNLPLERFDIDDGRATRAYFSRDSGAVELITDRGSRTLAWLGAIPHWFYFTPLRTRQPVWYWTVVWVAGVGCLLAVLGLILAFTQFRRSKPFRLAASIRYRGWMRWHYYSGALFGVFALTWVFSGLLSMEPFDWTNASGLRLPPMESQGGTLDLERFTLTGSALGAALDGEAAFEIEFARIQAEPYLIVSGETPQQRRIVAADSLRVRSEPFPVAALVAEIEALVSDAAVRDQRVLDTYDAYYYARNGEAPLPVLKVEFDDPADTWYYFDLATREPVYANHRLSRLERWLFNGLHSLDFGFWYDRRPLWDVGMILLSLGALATSGIGMYLGCRRLFGRPASRPG